MQWSSLSEPKTAKGAFLAISALANNIRLFDVSRFTISEFTISESALASQLKRPVGVLQLEDCEGDFARERDHSGKSDNAVIIEYVQKSQFTIFKIVFWQTLFYTVTRMQTGSALNSSAVSC